MVSSPSPRDGVAASQSCDAVVVGAGFAGLYALYKLRGLGLSVRLYEAGSGVGGVWFWNRYPGARCDVESVDYSYSFSEELQQEWHWPEKYSAQPDIERYANHVADRFDLRRDISLETRVTSATFDESTDRWQVDTDRGGSVSAQFLVLATGMLSVPKMPVFPGLETFRGTWYHTAAWPDEKVDFTGQRVAVIGTGSSGTQVTPIIAEEAGHLFVMQRTPNFSVPAQNAPLDEESERAVKSDYAARRALTRQTASGLTRDTNKVSALEVSPEERQRVYEEAWRTAGFGFILSFKDLVFNREANDTAVEFIRSKIRDIVQDSRVAQLLLPTTYPFGTKRPCVDTGYYPTFNRDNVTLVDLQAAPLQEVTPTGVRTADAHYELDSIVFATGFDAMTGALMNIDIRGRGGETLREHWSAGPRTFLGLQTAGFPNMFIITGPGSPSVLTNMVVSIEQHVEWIAELIEHLRARELDTVDATAGAQDAWVEHVNELAAMTLYPAANSWYLGANVPGKPRVFMPYPGGLRAYRRKCTEVADAGYEGFQLTCSPQHKDRAAAPAPV